MRLPLRTPKSPVFLLRLLLIVWSLANISSAADTPPSVNLAWNANPEADIAGYRVQYGTVSGNLTLSQTVGTTPAATLTGLKPGTRYYCAVRAFNISALEGLLSSEISFITPATTGPEIEVYQGNGSSLTSRGGPLSFGNCNLGTTTRARTFTIKNTGSTTLAGLSVASDGPDFNLGSLDSTSLAPGASTDFKVRFQPSVAGTRGTRLVIASNDADERQFIIGLTGIGIEVPEIGVELSSGKSLTDNESFINSGTVEVGSTARSRTFTIRNTGTANLDGLGIVKNGIHSPDFRVSALRTRSLAPGASTTFKVHFSPTKVGIRWVAIRIISNDADERSFDIVLAGTGRKSSGAVAATTSVTAGQTTRAFRPVKRIELIDGRKYLTLTITKTPGTTALPREVEVSSNLVDWSSGTNHTTVLLDNATTFKARDNTPVTRDAKRYIRLKR